MKLTKEELDDIENVMNWLVGFHASNEEKHNEQIGKLARIVERAKREFDDNSMEK